MIEKNYAWALEEIDKYVVVNCIAEVGSWHAYDAIHLARKYKAKVYVFEPDPINYKECKKNIKSHDLADLDIELFEIALTDVSGIGKFYSIDPQKYSNRGASSLFEINFSSRPRHDRDISLTNVQMTVEVKTARYEDLGLQFPQLIAMDVQGAELLALKGFGEALSEVAAIILETSFSDNYYGGSKFPDIHRFLVAKGFKYVISNKYGNKIPKRPFWNRVLGLYPGEDFDCLYINENNLR